MSDQGEAKAAIVTGASSGVGREVAKKLVGKGWRVALVARTEEDLKKTAEQSADPDKCLVIPADLTNYDDARGVVKKAHETFGRLDGLVNNAGKAGLTPIENQNEKTLQDMFAVNVFGPGVLIAETFPIMRSQKSGRIVNVASKALKDPFPGFFAYGAAKAALDSFTRSIEKEGGRRGVHGFTVAPGAIETEMLRDMFSTDQLPKDKTLDPGEVADLIVSCLTGEKDDEAGQTLTILPS